MRGCTIIISHYESVNFLHACINQIRKYKHPEIVQHIIVADQSNDLWHNNIVRQYWGDEDITVVKMAPLYSGFGIDYIMRNVEIKTEYICQIHVDVVPISKQWLLLPITLLEENLYHFVGQLQFISKISDSIYPNHTPFFAMAQSFNVARTATYKEMSLHAGFTRFHNRPQSGLKFINNDWDEWAAEDYDNRGSDDDVVAFYWEDRHREHDKLALRFTGMIDKQYGRVIENIVFHFGSCREAKGNESKMGKDYAYWVNKISNGYDEKLIERILGEVKPIESQYGGYVWDGKKKTYSELSPELTKRIEELKKE